MGTWSSIALALVLCGCSNSDNSASSVNGTVGGTSFSVASAISWTGFAYDPVTPLLPQGDMVGWVILSSADDACVQIETGHEHPNETVFEIELFNYAILHGDVSAPTAPGVYSVWNGAIMTDVTQRAMVIADSLGSNCNLSGENIGESGMVTLTSLDSIDGVYAGTFDVTFGNGDHVTGSFNPTACAYETPGGATCE